MAPGGDCGRNDSPDGTMLSKVTVRWMAGTAPDTATFASVTFAQDVFKYPEAATSLWQQLCEAGMAAFPHSAIICLQHAISAGVICAPGSTQAIAGATSGSHTARVNASWRIGFILRHRFDYTMAPIRAAVSSCAGEA